MRHLVCFSELLREAEQGTSFVIRRRGKIVADLFRQIRRRVPGRVNIRELVEKGRRN
ncbi:MAG TPA: hypothetical protein VFT63_04225 [bacterium]|nr:hypothetical protein [bacterium]